MKSVRVGIVGCGRMGRERARACRVLGADLVFAFDRERASSREFGKEFECETISGVEAIDWTSIDALFVCVPPSERGSLEVAAIRASVALFVEKPVGLSVEHCRPIIDALQSSEVITSVGYMNRYRESVQQARRVLQKEQIIGSSSFWLGTPYRVGWWAIQDLSGGAVNEQTTHLVDLIRYLVGEIASVSAKFVPHTASDDVVGTVAVTMETERGVLCSLLYSCVAQEKMIGLRVFTPGECLHLEGWDFRIGSPALGLVPSPEVPQKTEIFVKEVRAFLEAVRGGPRSGVLCSFQDALQTQGVVDAIRVAMRTGKTEHVSRPSWMQE